MATSTITIKKDTTDNWTNSHRVLDDGELGLEITEAGHRALRIGDGIHEFMELPVTVDIDEVRQIKTDMETKATEEYTKLTEAGKELLEEMKGEAGTVTLTDTSTGTKYHMGLEDGTMFFEEVTEE